MRLATLGFLLAAVAHVAARILPLLTSHVQDSDDWHNFGECEAFHDVERPGTDCYKCAGEPIFNATDPDSDCVMLGGFNIAPYTDDDCIKIAAGEFGSDKCDNLTDTNGTDACIGIVEQTDHTINVVSIWKSPSCVHPADQDDNYKFCNFYNCKYQPEFEGVDSGSSGFYTRVQSSVPPSPTTTTTLTTLPPSTTTTTTVTTLPPASPRRRRASPTTDTTSPTPTTSTSTSTSTSSTRQQRFLSLSVAVGGSLGVAFVVLAGAAGGWYYRRRRLMKLTVTAPAVHKPASALLARQAGPTGAASQAEATGQANVSSSPLQRCLVPGKEDAVTVAQAEARKLAAASTHISSPHTPSVPAEQLADDFVALNVAEPPAALTCMRTFSDSSRLRNRFRNNHDAQDLSDIRYRPMPRLNSEPVKDITESLREAMAISHFSGKTSRFIEEIISEGWKLANDCLSHGILGRHPGLTRNGVFALTVFTLELQAFVDDATEEDEFYFQFGNTLRYRIKTDIAKLKPYLYHFINGLEAMPKYKGTLWRGVHGDFAGIATEKFRLHGLINFNAPSSATPSRDIAKGFAGGNGLLLKFVDVTSSARDVREVSAYPCEDERTILAGSQFIVISEVLRADDGLREIHLKEAQAQQH